jgi:uncharacterized protein (DUF58 family)
MSDSEPVPDEETPAVETDADGASIPSPDSKPDPDPDHPPAPGGAGSSDVAEDADAVTRVVRTVPTNRWTGVDALALLAGGLGVITRQPSLLLVGIVGVAYAAYARAGPTPVDLHVERELSDPTPDPGDEVVVTVRVRNVGSGTLPDLRLVDGVPPALEAEDVARHGTALRPGKRATFSYTVRAVRGEHAWEPLTALVRDAAGATERVVEVDAGTTLQCTPRLEATADVPLRGLTTQYSGRVATDVAGAGVEFYATREYRPGDPQARVDWNRWARTGELATLEFREERAASVVLLVDAREHAYVAPDEETPNAVERAVDAASAAVPALLDAGDRVGIAALADEEVWLGPGAGDEHRARARLLLATHPAFAATPGESQFFPAITLRRLRRRLPADSQILLFSPLADDYLVTVARRLDAYGHLVTVVSPNPTAEGTTGELLARIERRTRIRRLREHGIRVVDWAGDGAALATELEKARTRRA